MSTHVKRISTREAGFSLLEVMVALVLLAVGLIAVMQLFPAALNQSRIAAERTTVASIANSELGRVKAGGVSGQLSDWATENALKNLDETQRGAMHNGWTSTVQRVGGDTDIFRVTFSVNMVDDRQERFVTYVTKQ